MKKHLLIILGIGIPFGILLSVLKNKMNLTDEQFRSYYLIFAAVIIIGSFVVNFVWQLSFLKKLMKLTSLLNNEKNPDQFIEENEKLLQRVKSAYNRSLVSMNISVGYSEKRDYKRAKEILLDIPEKHMKGINKVIYNHNLCYFYFMLDENEQGIVVFSSNRKLFQKFENHPSLGGSITVNRIHYHIARDETEQAKLLLEEAKNKYTDPKYLEDFEALDNKLNNYQSS